MTNFFSPPAMALIEFTVIVMLLALTVGLILTALNELYLRGLINRTSYRLFHDRLKVQANGPEVSQWSKVFPDTQELGFWVSVLPYRQFCGRVYSFATDQIDPRSEEGPVVEQMIDDLQVRIGTLWTWTMYYLAIAISIVMAFLFVFGLETVNEGAGDAAVQFENAGANTLVTLSGAVLGGFIAPLLVQYLEQRLSAR